MLRNGSNRRVSAQGTGADRHKAQAQTGTGHRRRQAQVAALTRGYDERIGSRLR